MACRACLAASSVFVSMALMCVAGCMDNVHADALPPNGRLVHESRTSEVTQKGHPALEKFTFAWQESSGIQSSEIIKISGCNAMYIFSKREPRSVGLGTRNVWYLTRFDLSDSTLGELRELICKNEFIRLSKQYDSDVADGALVWIKLSESGFEKEVICNNYFPPAVRDLASFIRELLATRRTEIADAKEISFQEASSYRLDHR